MVRPGRISNALTKARYWLLALSLVVLAIALLARYAMHLRGAWRWIYVVTAVMALYLNVFVGIVQAFQKVPALKALLEDPEQRVRDEARRAIIRIDPQALSESR